MLEFFLSNNNDKKKKILARKCQNVNYKFTLTRGLSLSKHFSFENTQPFFENIETLKNLIKTDIYFEFDAERSN